MRRGGSPNRYHHVWANLKARAPEHQRVARAKQAAERARTWPPFIPSTSCGPTRSRD